MSLEAWGDEDFGDGSFTDNRVEEIGKELFRTGAQMCREMMARFLEQGGCGVQAQSVRLNWNPAWGPDPGNPTDRDYVRAMSEISVWDWTP